MKRVLIWIVVAVVLADVVAQTWINGHMVDLVVVNASGQPVEIARQPAPGEPLIAVADEGCASHSLDLSRGSSWQVLRDGQLILDSASASLPLFPSLVAVEVWFDPDGSVRIVPAHEVGRLIDAPIPNCKNGAG